MTESLDELIQRVLDGDATPAERALLENRLANDPAARSRREEIGRVFQALEGVRVEDPPAGLRDDILRAVRGAAPAWRRAPARTGRPVFSWLRLTLPLAGAVAALVIFVSWQGLNRSISHDGVTGTMSGVAGRETLRLGTGGDAVLVRTTRLDNGFRLTIQAGNSPVTVVLETPDPGVTLRPPGGDATPGPRVETSVPAKSLVVIEGNSQNSVALIRVTATPAGGSARRGEVVLRDLHPSP